MKPEELLMQYYQYWTQPTDGPAHIKPPDDHEATVEALRIGAEAISERDALKDETQQVRRFLRGCMNHAFDETPLVQVARDVSGEFHRNRYQIQQRNTQINEMREERDAMKAEVERLRFRLHFLETAGYSSDGWCEHERRYQRTSGGDGDHCYICEVEELKQRIEELTKTLADEAEHNDTAPHEGCSCQRCMMIRRIAELEAELTKIHKHWRKPTHGPCCTCQRCGQDYDDCRCSLDDVADELEKAQQRITELETEKEALALDEARKSDQRALEIERAWDVSRQHTHRIC